MSIHDKISDDVLKIVSDYVGDTVQTGTDANEVDLEFAKSIFLQIKWDNLFLKAIQAGHLKKCKWIEQSGIVSINYDYALIEASKHGQVNVCKWIYNLNKMVDAIKYTLPISLSVARAAEHVEVCRWILSVDSTLYDSLGQHSFQLYS